jgi:hypothetical protein
VTRLLGTHQLIAWWQDRADQEYDVTWRLEQGRVGAGQAPVTTISGPTRPSAGEEVPARGSLITGTQDGRSVPLGFSVAPGVTSNAGRLAARLGVLSLAVKMELEDGTDVPLVVYLTPSGGYERERVPIVLSPGQASEVVAAVPDCSLPTCSSWDLAFGAPAEEGRQVQVRLSGEAVLRLWPLSYSGSAP